MSRAAAALGELVTAMASSRGNVVVDAEGLRGMYGGYRYGQLDSEQQFRKNRWDLVSEYFGKRPPNYGFCYFFVFKGSMLKVPQRETAHSQRNYGPDCAFDVQRLNFAGRQIRVVILYACMTDVIATRTRPRLCASREHQANPDGWKHAYCQADDLLVQFLLSRLSDLKPAETLLSCYSINPTYDSRQNYRRNDWKNQDFKTMPEFGLLVVGLNGNGDMSVGKYWMYTRDIRSIWDGIASAKPAGHYDDFNDWVTAVPGQPSHLNMLNFYSTHWRDNLERLLIVLSA